MINITLSDLDDQHVFQPLIDLAAGSSAAGNQPFAGLLFRPVSDFLT